MTVIFHPEARAEFTHDISYYAAQRHGLGVRFRNVVQEIISAFSPTPDGVALWKPTCAVA